MAEKKTIGKKCGRPSKVAVKAVKQSAVEHIGLVKNDSWLEPFEQAIQGRHDHALYKLAQFTQKGKKTLSDFATGHLYFGLHKQKRGWVSNHRKH